MDRHRPRGRRADGEDRVGVAQQHDALRTLAFAHGEQVVAQRCLPLARAVETEQVKARLQPVLYGIDTRFVEGARFDGRQGAQVGEIAFLLAQTGSPGVRRPGVLRQGRDS